MHCAPIRQSHDDGTLVVFLPPQHPLTLDIRSPPPCNLPTPHSTLQITHTVQHSHANIQQTIRLERTRDHGFGPLRSAFRALFADPNSSEFSAFLLLVYTKNRSRAVRVNLDHTPPTSKRHRKPVADMGYHGHRVAKSITQKTPPSGKQHDLSQKYPSFSQPKSAPTTLSKSPVTIVTTVTTETLETSVPTGTYRTIQVRFTFLRRARPPQLRPGLSQNHPLTP